MGIRDFLNKDKVKGFLSNIGIQSAAEIQEKKAQAEAAEKERAQRAVEEFKASIDLSKGVFLSRASPV